MNSVVVGFTKKNAALMTRSRNDSVIRFATLLSRPVKAYVVEPVTANCTSAFE